MQNKRGDARRIYHRGKRPSCFLSKKKEEKEIIISLVRKIKLVSVLSFIAVGSRIYSLSSLKNHIVFLNVTVTDYGECNRVPDIVTLDFFEKHRRAGDLDIIYIIYEIARFKTCLFGILAGNVLNVNTGKRNAILHCSA